MAAEAIALIVVGSGEVTDDEVADLLNDAYGDVEEVSLTVPVDRDLFTDAVKSAVDWYNNDKEVIAVQTEGASLSRASAKIGDGTEKVEKITDFIVPKEFEEWDEVHVLIAMPPEEDEDDYDFYAEIADAALEAGFKALALNAGLDDIVVTDPEDATADEEPEPEPEPEPEKPARRTRSRKTTEAKTADTVEEVKESTKAPEVEEEPPAPVEPKDGISESQKILDAYHYLKGVHEALGVALEALAMTPVLDTSRNEPAEGPKEEAPKSSGRGRGRPRTNFEVKQIEEDGEWIPRPAGRMKKGTKWRTIHAESGEVLDEGTAG